VPAFGVTPWSGCSSARVRTTAQSR
jgi:hypothetical protein